MAIVRSHVVRALSLALLAAAVRPASAQMVIPDKFENLQVLPKDIPRDTLVAIMRGFAGSLGVRCTFCHMEAASGGGQLNFASDERDHKRIARVMLRMVDSINTKLLPLIPDRDDPPTNVSCLTCHRGLPKPATIENVLLGTTTRLGVDSAIARYRTLRNDMALGRYNFGEQPVSEAAARLSAQGRHDDAIKLLQMNQEFYPNSVDIDFRLAEAYIAKGDRDAGIARLRAMLTKNPNDRRARARLQQLGVQP
jgi:hypothetical protein